VKEVGDVQGDLRAEGVMPLRRLGLVAAAATVRSAIRFGRLGQIWWPVRAMAPGR
jgi:hypothetical protein